MEYLKLYREFNLSNILNYLSNKNSYNFRYLTEVKKHSDALDDIDECIKTKINITCHQWAFLNCNNHIYEINEQEKIITISVSVRFLTKDEIPKENDLIFYYDKNKKLKHTGIFKDNTYVISKFGLKSVYEHEYNDIFYMYGFYYTIARLDDEYNDFHYIETKFNDEFVESYEDKNFDNENIYDRFVNILHSVC